MEVTPYSSLSRMVTRQVLNVSKDGDSVTSLGSLCQWSVTLTVKKMFPDVQTEPPALQFVPTASGLVNLQTCVIRACLTPHRLWHSLQHDQRKHLARYKGE